MSTTSARPTLLLVHGAWHRSSCWAKLQKTLAAQGWESQTVDLPSTGTGIRTAGLHEDARVIGERLRRIDGPVAVVSHSYSGLPVTQEAGDHPNVTRLVYLASYLPAVGQSMYELHGIPAPDDPSGNFPLIDNPRVSLYGDLSDDEAENAVGQLVEQSHRSFVEKVTRAAWKTIPTTYIVCEKDQAIPPSLQETMSAHATNVERLSTNHSPFLSAPGELTTLLEKNLS
jgi:pimeloyl-ACP methyl ester carboxylesterase